MPTLNRRRAAFQRGGD